jgi:hypothetical protein
MHLAAQYASKGKPSCAGSRRSRPASASAPTFERGLLPGARYFSVHCGGGSISAAG